MLIDCPDCGQPMEQTDNHYFCPACGHKGEQVTLDIRTGYDVTPQRANNGLTVAELFCGGGLMAVGLKSAGFNITWANDFEKTAAKAYAHNIGEHVVCGDITDPRIQNLIPETDVIAGGPPCQDYSIAGNGEGEDGIRGKLVFTYLSIIWMQQPKAFIFENVKGLIQKKHRHTFDALIQQMEFIGYRISWKLINSWDYGVAQKRERVFIVGIREDLGFEFDFPEPKEEEYKTQVLRDVIGDLPEPHGIELSEKALAYMERDPRHYQKHKPAVYEQSSPTLPSVLHKGVPYGLFFPPNHKGTTYVGKLRDRFCSRPTFWDKPSPTIANTADAGGAMPHPHPDWSDNDVLHRNNDEQIIYSKQAPRRFTVRECLRIQSVPDWYVMPEGMGIGAQYRIVGNGVASKVAYDLGIALAEQLQKGAMKWASGS